MFLKSIEIRGFKSFADKTELTFKKGITAVVGPNGSGKSNISDAVRWVLGEQSARNLRGDKMEDVIFAGTQFRKPVGLAQVSLSLDNSDCALGIDYSNVTISRRLYRSGESEYLINNTSCRLKDVQQLFMDTGIGKEGYSIIGQGKIDAILSGKTEERRKLFEEAAGIVKFKTRKEEAEKRLSSTDQNLIRIQDILSTYEERLEPLLNESEKAKQFLKLFEELKSKEVSIIIDSINKVCERIKINHKESDKLKLQALKGTEEKLQFKKDVRYWNDFFEKFEIKKQEEKQSYYNDKLTYQNSVSEMNILNERIGNLDKVINKTLSERDIIQNKLKEYKCNLDTEDNSLNSIRNTKIEIVETIISKEKKINGIQQNIAMESNEAKTLQEKGQINTCKVNEATNKLLILNNNLDTCKSRIETLKNTTQELINSVKINSTSQLMLTSKLRDLKEKILLYESNLKNNKTEKLRLQTILISEESTMKSCNFKISKADANFTILTNLEKKHEGYNKSVKNLMQHMSEGKVGNLKECFVLGEIIKVKKSLEIAVEIALGGSISHIITRDETVAKVLINYLKSYNLGRATFLPLSIIKGKRITIDMDTKNNHGFVGIANDLIDYDEKFSEVMAFILGRTIICKDMDSALEISRKNNYRFKIVTLSGEVINVGGSLTGGSIYTKTSSIIGRKREIVELAKELNNLQDESVINLEQIKQRKVQILKLEGENIDLLDKVYLQSIERTKLEAKTEAIKDEVYRLNNNIKTLGNEKCSEESKLLLGNKEIDYNNKSIVKFTNEMQIIKQNITKVDFKLKDSLFEIDNIKELIVDAKIKKAQIDETINNKCLEIRRLNEEILVYDKKIISFTGEIREAKNKKLINYSDIQCSEKKIKDIKTILEEMEERFDENEIEKIKIKEHIKMSEEKLEIITQEQEKAEKDLNKYDIALAKFEMEKDSYYQKLNDDFELTFAEALQFKSDIDDIDLFKKVILGLKSSISMLGKINVSAIEEYKEVKEKFTFMNDQKEDLVLAKDELLTVIFEMTEKMKKIFAENFVILRKNFNETFMELFKGGTADLILTEGDELTSKIDINVQPPGKKLQNLSLMSGGEKVLSAIALLFAILKMKPTPFCILDEIEAALDDANVVRYAEFLKRFSDNVQFIIITHRKGTMEAGDVLYGVTMEEKGVSKIVSVDFNK